MIFFLTLTVLGVSVFLCLVRAIKGPTPFDRILSISSIGTIIAIGISVHGFAFNRPDFVDISLQVVLLSNIGHAGPSRLSTFFPYVTLKCN